ncbi:MAG TPA: energy transducer TonB [Rhizomicrobium sp.]|jgi:protein TonB|nr:energy transducer TonB [Rhizomicrobium sp.]
MTVLCVSSASASESPPSVDISRPHPQPPYPDSAQLNGEQGTVMVDVFVHPNGRAAKFKVSRSSGFTDLDNAAVEGVLNWRYLPAIRDGETVSDWTTVKIVFQLPPAATPSN